MKSDIDPRHTRRIMVVQELFAFSFNTQTILGKLTRRIVQNESSLDKLIAKAAPQWEVAKIDNNTIRQIGEVEFQQHSIFTKEHPMEVGGEMRNFKFEDIKTGRTTLY